MALIILSGAFGTFPRTVRSIYVGRADIGTLVWVGEGKGGEAKYKTWVPLEMVMALVRRRMFFLDFPAKYFFFLIGGYKEF